MRKTYVWDSETRKFVEKKNANTHRPSAGPAIFGDIRPYVSPVDGTVITGRRALRDHNKRNNVLLYEDVKPEFEQKAKERELAFRMMDQRAKQDRIEAIKHAIEKHRRR